MSAVTQLYFQIVEENNMFRPFSEWAIIRLRLEYRTKLVYCNVDIKNGGTRFRFKMFREVCSYEYIYRLWNVRWLRLYLSCLLEVIDTWAGVVFVRFKLLFYTRNNSIPKFIFRLSRFPVYRRSGLGRFYCINSGFGGLLVSMMASGTQDRGFAPDRSRRIFPARKIHSMPSFEGEVK
jgi:hypothetical protein